MLDLSALTDPIPLARRLIQAPSVTPADAGALDVLSEALETLGFECTRFKFEEVDNLYARLGQTAPVFCFAGHTDVVPPGDEAAWSRGPFEAEIADDVLWGRGASDMKGAIAAMVAGVARLLQSQGRPAGSIAFLITGDEEGPAVNGTKKLLKAVAEKGERFDHCLVGEPTNPHHLGDTIKVGRRGSLNGVVTVTGQQGHVAYPEKAENPIPVLIDFLNRITSRTLDEGAPHFQPSNLEVTTIDVGNAPHNVIPAKATAKFNIRFNTAQTGDGLKTWLREQAVAAEQGFFGDIDLDLTVTGDAFLTETGPFTDLLRAAVRDQTGHDPALTTGGGTSDARFIKDYCPVAEFGLVGETMHQVDERVPVSDVTRLAAIYADVLQRYFKTFAS
ncbi:MAG: succinyl-diaminopimelate desuccinylase [Oceanicaulis sp.]|uniref:succinyl-diaminopimelate desuccinylase n=1 Tax=unclassified Oceanicaulis TaxID=2632123 RepID=UPI000C472EA1|nr:MULTISPECIES: succinyl-diaminopimelate desuccinylase [unclassified Oceanicaulis]MAB68236.1 succinyl-diaminopimelate desuccinylase [Oceanicaulis sp.]MBC40239.1 succinyl-diaminopimelate desuccinylase [Oceanicaulis sp.]MBG34340.1 succinyl-diaminopimelate desuccinylase [Oceanicaulis sp.]HBU63661.1 succinyl-diaminopimelate desuccinylase [Oceanicaulis sp.]